MQSMHSLQLDTIALAILCSFHYRKDRCAQFYHTLLPTQKHLSEIILRLPLPRDGALSSDIICEPTAGTREDFATTNPARGLDAALRG